MRKEYCKSRETKVQRKYWKHLTMSVGVHLVIIVDGRWKTLQTDTMQSMTDCITCDGICF